MTKAQERAIEKVRTLAERWAKETNQEIKRFNVETLKYSDALFVAVDCGTVGDEGTVAEYLARDHMHLFVGPRGGAYYYGNGMTRKSFHWVSIIEAVVR